LRIEIFRRQKSKELKNKGSMIGEFNKLIAAINTPEQRNQARALHQKIQQGEEKAATSAFTFNEILLPKFKPIHQSIFN
jgi:hypothetical protein